MKPATVLAMALAGGLAVFGVPTEALDLQGHRGARGLAPENTLPAFAAALAHGVTTLELDVGITADGVAVVAHDRRLNPDIARDASGQYVSDPLPTFASLTLDRLKAYDVGRLRPGSRYATDFPQQQPVDGTPIPTLSEVFALVRKAGNDRVRFNIETKISPLAPSETVDPETFATTLLDAIRREGFLDRVSIQSFDWRTLLLVQRLEPAVPTVYLTSQQGRGATIAGESASPWTGGVDIRAHGSVPLAVKAAGGRVWSPNYRDLDAGALAEAHGLGLDVVVWTVNDPAEMARMVDLGVDGIISDRPDVLATVARDKGILVPTPTPVQP